MGEDSFLDRWSRLKRTAGETEPEAPAPDAGDVDAGAVDAAAGEPALTAEEVAALPDVANVATPEALGVFLRRGVPAALRQAALRRMWVLNPAIRDYVDDAREYAMDWNAPGGVPGGGIVSRQDAQALVERLFAAREPRAAPPPPEERAAGAETPPAGQAAAAAEDSRIEGDTGAAAQAGDAAEPMAPRRRHGGATPV